MPVRASNLCRAVAVIAAAWSAVAGCGDVAGGDLAGTIEDNAPERLRGLSVGYDVTALFRPAEPPLSPEPQRESPTVLSGSGPVRMTVWWRTPDGRTRSEDRPAAEVYEVPSRYAGAVWVAVTPFGATPRDLVDAESEPQCDARARFGN